jgi:ABC-2 type transport system permease protein
MRALIFKEIRGFFSSLIGYVVIAAFLLLMGLFLWVFPGPWNILSGGVASMDPFFTLAPWVLLFLIPAITMRSFAEERRSGTLELLLTRPLLEGEVVFAKFIGALALIFLALVPTLGFVWVLGELGSPQWNLDLGAIWGSYIGLFMLSSSIAAIGIFASASTSQPLVAFLSAMIFSTVVYIGFTALGDFALLGHWDYYFVNLGFESHYSSLSRGLIDSRDIAYFIFVDVLFLQLARFILALERGRIGREGLRLSLVMSIFCVLLFSAHIVHFSVDLTSEKRHTLTEGSLQLMEELNADSRDVIVTCYLTGDFPAQWKRLENSIREKLEEFAVASSNHLRFQFVDIYETDDPRSQGQNEEKLLEQGISFTRIGYETGGGKTFRNVWPSALISSGGNEVPVQFFRSDTPQPTEEMIQGSINSIEYELSTSLRRVLFDEVPNIAFIEGHGELPEMEVADFMNSLDEDYNVSRIRLDGKINILSERLEGMRYRTNRFDLVVIAGPDSTFSDKDRLILDQFLMGGGRMLWMVDPILTDLDSLRSSQTTMATANPIGLNHQFFDYGVRLNRNLVIDPQCAPIAFDAGPQGNQRSMQLFSWYFSPLAIPQGISHPITTNLDPIHFDFVSGLDTVSTDADLKKTVLLRSSALARTYKAPIRISSSIVDLDPSYFNSNNTPYTPFAVLIEGSFKSHFTDILPDTLLRDADFAFRAEGRPSAMVVIGDGDIAKNKVILTQEGPQIYPLGYDRYAGRVVYDNKEFLRNVVNHLLDESSIISVRSRAITLRSLDKDRITTSRLGWQSLAIGLPLLVVLLSGLVIFKHRSRVYGG